MERVPLAVVGAGIAGAAAAIEAARAGVQVTLIDENPIEMSMMALDTPLFFGQRLMPTLQNRALMFERVVQANDLLSVADEAGVDIQLGTYVWGAFRNTQNVRQIEGPQLGLANDETSWILGYDRLILATGARDLGMGYAGWERVGSMGANGLHSLLTRYQALTAQRLVVLGSGNLGLRTAILAIERGVEVKAIVDVSPMVRGDMAMRDELEDKGVRFYTSHTVKKAKGPADDIDSLVLVEIGENNRPINGSEKEVACDTVVLAIGLVPNVELMDLLQCDLQFQSELGGWVPVVDEWMRSSVETVFVAGDAAGSHDGMVSYEKIAENQGRLAGIAAAESLGAVDSATARTRQAQLQGPNSPSGPTEVHSHWKAWVHSLIGAGGLGVFACQCEEVTRGEVLDVAPPRYLNWESDQTSGRNLQSLLKDGPVNPDQVKRLTRAGMGYCQGKRCREQVSLLLAEYSNTDIADVPMMSYRPPVRPLSMGVLWPHEETQQERDNWQAWFKPKVITLEREWGLKSPGPVEGA